MTFGFNDPESSDTSSDPIYGNRADRYSSWDSEPEDPDSLPSVTSTPAPRRGRRGGIFREILETALIALVIFFGVRMLVLNFRVDGSSMFPNLHDGDMLLVNRNSYEVFDLYTLIDWIPGVDHADAKEFKPFDDPERGDIVVFNPPVASSKPYIKRIIGLPGETVEIREGNVYIDGELLDEDYIEAGITECSRQCDPWVVPEGEVFVLGDNRQNSSDSRVFGPIAIDSIVGRAWVIYWPVGDIGILDHADYPDE
ncbi:MAG: signal peptidase I [Thermomicrobiales bacterium]|nr:signal peptidase I [Thermomicrobiales bacterium]